jgi:hypothetical protein
MAAEVKLFTFDEDVLDALETSISSERMATYVSEAAGDRELALRLYTWNTAISAAFYGPLQGLEVAVRNAMHQQLAAKYGADWYNNHACGLDAGALRRLEQAVASLKSGGYPLDPPHVVAELPFGFWVSLLGPGGKPPSPEFRKRNYEMTLWRPALFKAFPHCRLSRRETHKPLNSLRTLRNRIAHHEPVFYRNLAQEYQSILTVADWICPRT